MQRLCTSSADELVAGSSGLEAETPAQKSLQWFLEAYQVQLERLLDCAAALQLRQYLLEKLTIGCREARSRIESGVE